MWFHYFIHAKANSHSSRWVAVVISWLLIPCLLGIAQDPAYQVVNAPWEKNRTLGLNTHEHLISVDKFHPHNATLIIEAAEMQKRYYSKIVPRFHVPLEIKTDVLAKLCPHYHFYRLSWDELPNPENKEKIHGLAYGLYQNIVIDPQGGVQCLNVDTSNHSDTGKFLVEQKLKITTREDARDLWMAFCDLHQKFWHSRDLQQISATEWHIGLHRSIDQQYDPPRIRDFYSIVTLNPDQTVQAIQFQRVKKTVSP
jgi:hypothetical protein